MLASSGRDYRILLARDGQEALTILQECRPQVILLDLIMPNMDGFEMLKKLKENDKLKEIPVLAYSASVLKDQKERIHKSEFAGLLTKPVNITELYVELMNHLPYKEVKKKKTEAHPPEKESAPVKDVTGLIESLETDFMEEWKSYEMTQPIGDIRKFGEKIIALGNGHNSSLVVNYGEDLRLAADNFDIEAILQLLKRYKTQIEELKKT